MMTSIGEIGINKPDNIIFVIYDWDKTWIDLGTGIERLSVVVTGQIGYAWASAIEPGDEFTGFAARIVEVYTWLNALACSGEH
jgi:hypothetical protein